MARDAMTALAAGRSSTVTLELSLVPRPPDPNYGMAVPVAG